MGFCYLLLCRSHLVVKFQDKIWRKLKTHKVDKDGMNETLDFKTLKNTSSAFSTK